MSYSNFDKICAENGFAIGAAGSEVALTGLFEPGNQFFVDSGVGSDSNTGLAWGAGSALATVDAAIGKCTANNGDIIWVAPGHAETWTTTGAKLVADIAGVRIIGLGQGSNRPTFSFGHTGTTWTISAASVTLANLLLVTAIDSVTTYGTISGADCTLIGIETRDVTDKEVVDAWTVTGDRLTVKDYFHNGYTGGNANARVFKMTGVDNALFEKCRFMTKVTTAVINFSGTACTNVVVKGCDFLVTSTTDLSKTVVDTIGGSTWEVVDCFDLGAGSGFSGGSGGALAKDDTGAVTTAVAALQAEVSGTAGIASFPAGVTAGNNVSIAEVLRYGQENIINGGTVLPATQSIYDLIAGANGIATWANGAAPGNGVSLSEGLRYLVDQVIRGTGTVLPDNQSLYDLLAGANGIATWAVAAAPANGVSLAEAIRYIVETQLNSVMDIREKVATKAAAVMVNGDTLFTVAGGPIQITGLLSICATVNNATASTLQYSSVSTLGTLTTTISAASGSLAGAPAGSSVSLVGTALSTAANYSATGANLSTDAGGIIVPAGTIKIVVGVGSTTGTWAHYLRYKPLATGVTVS